MPTVTKSTKKPATKQKPVAKTNPQSAIQIPQSKVPTTSYPVLLLDTALVHISEHNTRQPTPADCTELIASIAEFGQSTAAIARPHPTKKGHYELAAGARRRTAAAALGIQLKTEVRPLTDNELLDLILLENLQRQDPDPFAEARLIERRLAAGDDPATIAAVYGKPTAWVNRRCKLLNLLPAIIKRLTAGNLRHYTLPMAELLGSLTPDAQKNLLDHDWTLSNADTLPELVSTISTREALLTKETLKAFKDPRTDNPAAQCTGGTCCHSTASDLFSDLTLKEHPKDCARCLNPSCFKVRHQLAAAAGISDLLNGLTPATLRFFKENWDGPDEITYGDKTHKIARKYELEPIYTFHTTTPASVTDATAAIDLSNHTSPSLYWLRLKPNAASKAAKTPADKTRAAILKTAKANGEKLDETALTAALRRTNHQRKRWKHAHDALCTALEKLKAPDLTPDRWLALFVTFGSNIRRNTLIDLAPKKAWAAYAKLDPTATPTGPLVAAVATTCGLDPVRLFADHFHDLFQSRLKFYNGMENFDDDADLRHEMAQVATLIGFDLAAAKHAADLALPPPKSLGKVDPHTLLPLA